MQRSPLADRTGASSVEHVLAIALVALVAIGAWSALGDATDREVRCVAGAIAGLGAGCGERTGGDRGDARSHRSTLDPRAPGRGAVADALARLPAALRRALDAQGTRIVVTDRSVAGALPASLRSQRPRGWPDGTTFADVPAVYLPGSDRIVIAAGALGDRLPEALAHEIGHALDLGRGLSDSGAFRAAYAATQNGATSAYYAQPGRAGREETYAETFALYMTDPDTLRRHAPALYRYWRAHAGAALGARSEDLLARAGDEARPFDFGAGFVLDKVRHAGEYTPLGAALHHGPGLVESAARAAYRDTPLGSVTRDLWSRSPPEARTGARATAGAATGVAELTASLAELASRYSPTPAGMIRATETAFGLASKPRDTWTTMRAMPRAIASYYSELGHDVVSGDAFAAGRAIALLGGDAALMVVPAGAPARGATLARTGVARAELAALERTGVALERRGFIPATRGAPDVRAIIAERARMHAQLRARGDVFAWVGHDLDLLERAVRLPASDGPARLVIASPDFPPTFGNMLRFPLRERAPNGGFVKINDVDQLGVALQMMRSGYRIGTPLEVLASGVARRPGTAMLERDIPVYRANQEAFLAKYGHRADVAAIAPLARSKILATERHIAAGELDAAQTAADELDAMLLQLRYKPGSKLDVPELRELGSELWSIRRGIDYVDMPMGQLLADQLQVPVHAARGEVELRDVGGVTRVFVDGRELTAQTRAELMTEFHPEPLEAAERQKRLDWMQSVADEPIDPQDFGAINTYEGFPEADAIALERLRTSAMRHASSLDGALGVDLATATPREVRRAFRRWSRAHHPDALRAGRAMTDDEYRAAGHRFQEIHAQYQDYVARARP